MSRCCTVGLLQSSVAAASIVSKEMNSKRPQRRLHYFIYFDDDGDVITDSNWFRFLSLWPAWRSLMALLYGAHLAFVLILIIILCILCTSTSYPLLLVQFMKRYDRRRPCTPFYEMKLVQGRSQTQGTTSPGKS